LHRSSSRMPAMVEAIAAARSGEIPIVYVNDQFGCWDANARGLVRAALSARHSGDVIAPLAPEPDDRFVLKARYSAFDHTALALLLQGCRSNGSCSSAVPRKAASFRPGSTRASGFQGDDRRRRVRDK
jgi:isochorismate hydrolase